MNGFIGKTKVTLKSTQGTTERQTEIMLDAVRGQVIMTKDIQTSSLKSRSPYGTAIIRAGNNVVIATSYDHPKEMSSLKKGSFVDLEGHLRQFKTPDNQIKRFLVASSIRPVVV